MNQSEVSQKIRTNLPKTDNYTWIEETIECPACEQLSFDKIGAVDFDWNPDGVLTCGGYSYQCRVCGLGLTEYEYEIADTL